MIGRLHLHRMRRLHWVWHLLLAVGVLLGQVAVARHNLQHVQQVDQDAVHAVCAQCLALHAMDHAGTAPPAPALPLAGPAQAHHWAAAATPHLGPSPAPYRSRAPPALSA